MATVAGCLQLNELSQLTAIAGGAGLGGRPVRLTHAIDESDIFAWVLPDILVREERRPSRATLVKTAGLLKEALVAAYTE
ncbi:MAG: hypothetical protein OWU84_11860 [Firmicutes bacterium]|nr:hypothetical protein [Bacillota bacterium]